MMSTNDRRTPRTASNDADSLGETAGTTSANDQIGFALSAPRDFSVGVFPGLKPVLLDVGPSAEDLAAYVARGGYAHADSTAEQTLEKIEHAGLRGRGGAAFPTGLKLRSVADRQGPRVVVANGEEGEPASAKDRWLLRERPHLVLDGLVTVARAVDADRAYVYVSDAEAGDRVDAALRELRDGPGLPVAIEVIRVLPAYVAGEETALVRAINGGPALPVDKPPRPFEIGVADRPTAILNVETLANVPLVVTDPDAWRSRGSGSAAGTFLCTISGAVERPGLYEVPLGEQLGDVVRSCAGLTVAPSGYLLGGFYGGVLSPRHEELRLGYDEARQAGSALGCGAIVVLGPEDCPVAAVADVLSYLERENARQCGPCIRGTAAMRDVLTALTRGGAEASMLERLQGWSLSLPGRGACGLLDAAAAVAGSLLREFPQEVEAHLVDGCADGAHRASDHQRFAVELASA